MVSASTRVTKNGDAASAVSDGAEQALLDAGQQGFNTAREHAPVGASGYLQGQAMFEPQVQDDGSVIWGNNAEYAEDVEDGTGPHHVPIRALKRWARRVLGDESAAYPVQKSIAAEGTEAQPFIKPGIDAMRAWLSTKDLGDYVTERL